MALFSSTSVHTLFSMFSSWECCTDLGAILATMPWITCMNFCVDHSSCVHVHFICGPIGQVSVCMASLPPLVRQSHHLAAHTIRHSQALMLFPREKLDLVLSSSLISRGYHDLTGASKLYSLCCLGVTYCTMYIAPLCTCRLVPMISCECIVLWI